MARAAEQWREQIEKGVMPASVHKTFVPESVVGTEADGVRKAAFVVSTGSEDRDGDIVAPDGWLLDNYRKNPVVLWAHDVKSLPVARAESIGVHDGRLKSVTVFPEKGVYPFADQVFGLVKGGFLKGTSVGFHPLAAEPRKGRTKGIAFNRQELYEFSILPIPSNREALVEAKSAGHDIGMVVKWAADFLDYAEANGIWIPKFQIEKALKLVLPLTVTVPALPPAEASRTPEGHASAGAAPSDAEVKGWLGDFVMKHGDHDQSSHGRRGGGGDGGDSERASRASSAAGSLASGGGFSINLRNESPKTGYMVSPYKSRERIVDGDASAGDIAKYEADNHDLLSQPGHFLGGWKDGGKTYLDVSLNVQDRAEAHRIGHENGQLEVWNVAEGKSEKTEAPRKARGKKEAEMDDVVLKLADSLFGDGVKKAGPPWQKEQPPADEPQDTGDPEPKGEEYADPNEGAEQKPKEGEGAQPADKGQTPGGDPTEADPTLGGMLDQLAQGLLGEIQPLKQGGDPTQIATALKAALEKFAAAFMQTYIVPGAQAGAPGAPTPAAQPAAAPKPPAQPAAKPAAAPAAAAPAAPPAAEPQPDQKKKPPFLKGADFSLDLDEDEVRATIKSAVTKSFEAARMHLTGRLPG